MGNYYFPHRNVFDIGLDSPLANKSFFYPQTPNAYSLPWNTILVHMPWAAWDATTK